MSESIDGRTQNKSDKDMVSVESNEASEKVEETSGSPSANDGHNSFKAPEGITSSKNSSSLPKKSSVKSNNKQKDSSSEINPEYKVPSWSKTPDDSKYTLSEIKCGVIQSKLDLTKPFYIFGRHKGNDFVLAHPSVSRCHAVLQYGDPKGKNESCWYLYDMNSTHGTYMNKNHRIDGYTKLEDGFMFKLGFSTRFFVLDCIKPPTRSKSYRTSAFDEELNLDDEPCESHVDKNLINALKQWFQNEGLTPEFVIEGSDDFICKIKLPLKEIYDCDSQDFEGVGEGKTKDEATYEAVLKCWEHLESFGVTPFGVKRSRNWKENDYYDSDEDPFFDRTGDLEKKRFKRMKNDKNLHSDDQSCEIVTDICASLKTERQNLVEYIKYLNGQISKNKEGIVEKKNSGDDFEGYENESCLADLSKKRAELSEIDEKLKKFESLNKK